MIYLYYFIDSNSKHQFIISIAQHLENCITPLQTMRNKKCLVNNTFYKNNDYEDEDYSKKQVKEKLLSLRNKAETMLKHATKLASSKIICM